MKTIEIINQEVQTMNEELNKACGVFWAFGNKQFEENRTPLKDGEKYVSLGSGGYVTSGQAVNYIKGSVKIVDWRAKQIKLLEDAPKAILYEINNRECFFSGDLTDIYILFEGVYSPEFINKVYKDNYHTFNF